MGNFRKALEKQSWLVNVIVALIGLVLDLLALILSLSDEIKNIFLSIGCSLIATSIASWLASFYIINNNEIQSLITLWQLKGIYKTKSEMNVKSNECLDKAKKNIDIVAIGMSNFLSHKGDIIRKKAMSGVQVRIISCSNEDMLIQREKDETVNGSGEVIGEMKKEVKELTEWVKSVVNENGKITIKYHNTYPSFSYLRIDDDIFWGLNLPLLKSQVNFAFEFSLRGEGGRYLNDYFEMLWQNEFVCSEHLNFKEKV